MSAAVKPVAKPDVPYLSVIVPVHRGEGYLARTLEAMLASDLPRELWELIVVDDASTDSTPALAARYADAVVRLRGRPAGPAYARNRGVEACRGEIVVFIDADVIVHTDTLRLIANVFATEPEVAAVFGAYDNEPAAPGLVSQYRNLLHRYTHVRGAGEATTFWAGCGAIRRNVFLEAGMYDEWHFERPQIEDIELGHRIRALGYHIQLRPEIQGKHLKKWTLRKMIAADFADRGVPWMRLLVQEGTTMERRELNLRTMEKVNTVLVWLTMWIVLFAIGVGHALHAPAALLLLLPVLASNFPLYKFYAHERGILFALACVPLNLLYYLVNGVSAGYGWMMHHVVGEPKPRATTEAFSEIGVKTWPPVPVKRDAGAWSKM